MNSLALLIGENLNIHPIKVFLKKCLMKNAMMKQFWFSKHVQL